jgi:hypothetical protein
MIDNRPLGATFLWFSGGYDFDEHSKQRYTEYNADEQYQI